MKIQHFSSWFSGCIQCLDTRTGVETSSFQKVHQINPLCHFHLEMKAEQDSKLLTFYYECSKWVTFRISKKLRVACYIFMLQIKANSNKKLNKSL
jgi:hypothetical protein